MVRESPIPPTAKILPLESLRGLLAVWVLAAHVAGRSLSDTDIARFHLSALTEPLLPVYVFMILSGFVIFHLLDRSPLNIRDFLKRRLARILPLYLVVLIVAALLVGDQLHALESLPWRNRVIIDSIKVHLETLQNFWAHFLAHITLLHGVVPERWLPDANFSILSPGWSVSLEWQFYLIAPILFALVKTRRAIALCFLVTGVVALQLLPGTGIGFLPNQFQYFLVGIISYYAYKHLRGSSLVSGMWADGMLVVACFLAYVALENPWPIVLWLIVASSVITSRQGVSAPIIGWVTQLFEKPALVWLGRVSYSVYLVHIPILYVVFHTMVHVTPDLRGWGFMTVALPATLAISLAVSALTFRFIELPGMRWGRTTPGTLPASLQRIRLDA